ncbi:MAG: type II toxin-antitoxin system RelB/DinJ family antitoxin [Acidimicrobiaceae bacterium]|nr:type II toxin-antitoxin system RelB/DinJ family antitoxin [Acidimicrobiaceae bacterium]MYE76026.1 type II toxin-antitoxin system RelB/DinJ family antitoxin [Acidimicrobiaceae bacterium]MYH44463.1 type II toxin-antitoxin system RelB/DinJ family antitoxin [Acidimicrobiaceae bacterium]MYJ41264.1 type II toxin-antitoxin system RelB/DinJ family antitoxin [Acidimicrobiaceae bacterium]MYJ81811.1 type II toxin-antitoxin system RelB/DinJ family antitoxin [Acidimicrobiaceae bacterium]
MAKTETIRARVEPELKQQAEGVLRELGLSATEAITLFYTQVAMRRGLPFDVKIPNADTVQAMRQAESGERLIEYDDLDELKARLL